tara:strand:- start:882 stop:1151 length:270 start_codon:yes stop_codon:yes gene_type:complete
VRVKDLKPGMLLKPRDGFVWKKQHSAYLTKIMCLTVSLDLVRDGDRDIVMYVGEREPGDTSYGKQIVLWKGAKISVNPSAWRCIVEVKL